MQTIKRLKLRSTVQKTFGNGGTLQMGDARDQLAIELGKEIEKKINEYADKKTQYYILVKAEQVDPGQIHNNCSIWDEKPPAMLATMLFYVNNRTGEFRTEHVLPPDTPIDESILSGSHVNSVCDDVKKSGIPLI